MKKLMDDKIKQPQSGENNFPENDVGNIGGSMLPENPMQNVDENLPKADVLGKRASLGAKKKKAPPTKKEQTEKKKRVKKARTRRAKIIKTAVVLGVIFAIIFTISYYIIYGLADFTGTRDGSIKGVDIEIPRGATVSDVASILQENGLIGNSFFYEMYIKFLAPDVSYQYGTFKDLSSDMGYDMLTGRLEEVADIKPLTSVTIPEGYNMFQIADRLEEADVCDSSDFLAACIGNTYNYDFLKEIPTDMLYCDLEGYLFPETYYLEVGSDINLVINTMLSQYDLVFDYSMSQRAAELGMTEHEVITLASIIQAEAGDVSQMEDISSVFHNRLNNPGTFPRLESDPTIKYGRDYLSLYVGENDPDFATAYDTYQTAGFPPGAINNPGVDAINAALYPSETGYYYFCANIDTKETYFATTLAEHEQNLVKAGLA